MVLVKVLINSNFVLLFLHEPTYCICTKFQTLGVVNTETLSITPSSDALQKRQPLLSTSTARACCTTIVRARMKNPASHFMIGYIRIYIQYIYYLYSCLLELLWCKECYLYGRRGSLQPVTAHSNYDYLCQCLVGESRH